MWVTSIAAPVAIAGLGMTCYAMLRRQSINDGPRPDYTSYVLNMLRSEPKTGGDGGTSSDGEETESKFLMGIETPCLTANCSSQEVNAWMMGQEDNRPDNLMVLQSQAFPDSSFLSRVSSILSVVNSSSKGMALMKKNESGIQRQLSSSETYLKTNIDFILRREGRYDGLNSALFTTPCITRAVTERSGSNTLHALSMTCMKRHPAGTLCPFVKSAIAATRSLVFPHQAGNWRESESSEKAMENTEVALQEEDPDSLEFMDAEQGQEPGVKAPRSDGDCNTRDSVDGGCVCAFREGAGRNGWRRIEASPRIIHRVATCPCLLHREGGGNLNRFRSSSQLTGDGVGAEKLEMGVSTGSNADVDGSTFSCTTCHEEDDGFTSSWSLVERDGSSSWSGTEHVEKSAMTETGESSTIVGGNAVVEVGALEPGSIVSSAAGNITLLPKVIFVQECGSKDALAFRSQGLNEATPLVGGKLCPNLEVLFPPVMTSSRYSNWSEGLKAGGRVESSRTLIFSASCKDLHQFHNFVVQEILTSEANTVRIKAYRPKSLPDVRRVKEKEFPLELPKPLLSVWFSLVASVEERSSSSVIILILFGYVLIYFIMWASEIFVNYSWLVGSNTLVAPLPETIVPGWW